MDQEQNYPYSVEKTNKPKKTELKNWPLTYMARIKKDYNVTILNTNTEY